MTSKLPLTILPPTQQSNGFKIFKWEYEPRNIHFERFEWRSSVLVHWLVDIPDIRANFWNVLVIISTQYYLNFVWQINWRTRQIRYSGKIYNPITNTEISISKYLNYNLTQKQMPVIIRIKIPFKICIIWHIFENFEGVALWGEGNIISGDFHAKMCLPKNKTWCLTVFLHDIVLSRVIQNVSF